MSMSKYTAGPWEIAPRKARYRVTGEGAEALKACGLPVDIDMVSIGTSTGQVAAIPMDESNMANAYLIAAAPELLEAAETALDVLENALDDIVDHSKASPSLAKKRADAKRKLRMAIAKAHAYQCFES